MNCHQRIAGSSIRVGDLSAGDVDGPAWIGVMVNDLTPAFRNQFGLNVFRGAAVTSVSPNSPAFAIGMMAGDVAIVSIGGVAIETSGDLMKWMLTATWSGSRHYLSTRLFGTEFSTYASG